MVLDGNCQVDAGNSISSTFPFSVYVRHCLQTTFRAFWSENALSDKALNAAKGSGRALYTPSAGPGGARPPNDQ